MGTSSSPVYLWRFQCSTSCTMSATHQLLRKAGRRGERSTTNHTTSNGKMGTMGSAPFVGAILDFAMLAMTPRWAACGTALGLAWKLKLSLYVFNNIHRIVTSCLGVCILNKQRVKNIERQITFIHGQEERFCHEDI